MVLWKCIKRACIYGHNQKGNRKYFSSLIGIKGLDDNRYSLLTYKSCLSGENTCCPYLKTSFVSYILSNSDVCLDFVTGLFTLLV